MDKVEKAGNKFSRTDRKKAKELEEQRKLGNAPAEVDEYGNDINPHIPQYIVNLPWYYGENRPTLKHQRVQSEHVHVYDPIDSSYNRGQTQLEKPNKYREGACENCGAITHAKKDCLERPRNILARYSGEDLMPDEAIQPNLKLGYDGKRDRWLGYDTSDHVSVMEEYHRVEQAKQIIKAARLEDDMTNGTANNINVDDEDEDKYVEEANMPGQKFDSKHRTTVRNLRIREDTAKYLYNLDINSAYYDSKTRSMRDNPFKDNSNKGKNINYFGDNFNRYSGECNEMASAQLFSWQAHEKGADVHLQADPTKVELLLKQYRNKKGELKNTRSQRMIEKYGGEEHFTDANSALLFSQTEDYVEYSRNGKIIKGQEKACVKSKYEEDVYINNHTSVYGSYWKDFQWGYACCHSIIRNSYCLGEKNRNEDVILPIIMMKSENSETVEFKNLQNDGRKLEIRNKISFLDSAKIDSTDRNQNSAKDVKNDIKDSTDERDRKYNVIYDHRAPSEEEMETWRKKKSHPDDPLLRMTKIKGEE